MIEKSELEAQKNKLHRDRQQLEVRLVEITKEQESVETSIKSIDGAIQAVDYFIVQCEKKMDIFEFQKTEKNVEEKVDGAPWDVEKSE